MQFNNLVPVKMYCPNCANLLLGYKREDGTVFIECNKCRVVIVPEKRGRRTNCMRESKTNQTT